MESVAQTMSEGPREYVTKVEGVRLIELKLVTDERGRIAVGEHQAGMPFVPQRFFAIFDVPSGQLRGVHAHKTCHQLLICLRGSVTARFDDGTRAGQVVLDRPSLGLYMPPMVWGGQSEFSADAMVLVLASCLYSRAEYIEDYDEFVAAVKSRKA
jgi:dTDP-4-dehydrorhamnose 3,5-epimerase-like enzyme